MAQVTSSPVIEGGHASRGFHRMEEKIVRLEAEAEVARRPNVYGSQAGGVNYAPVDPVKQSKIDEQLQLLKQKK